MSNQDQNKPDNTNMNFNSASALETSVLTSLHHFIESKQKSDDVTSRLLLNLYQEVESIKKVIGNSSQKEEPVGSISNDVNQPQGKSNYEQLLEALASGNNQGQ